MTNPQTPTDRPTLDEIFVWFEHWLKEPLSHNDMVMIRETIYVLDNPEDVRKANAKN